MRLMLLALLVAACRGDSTTPSPGPEPDPAAREGLWTAGGSPPAVLRLAPPQLRDTGERVPATTITTPSARLNTLVSVAFDPDGALWLASADDDVLLSLQPDALTSSGLKTATTVIRSSAGSLSAPTGLAFDAAGRLWVANHENGTVVAFARSQLAAGGDQRPAVVLSRLGHPTALAFEGDGALWVSDNVAQTISQYRVTDLAASGSPIPAVVLTETAALAPLPLGLAFDADANLWVANLGARNLVAFSPAQRETSGSPVPQVTLASTAASLSLPVGLAFDSAGSLWVVGGTGTLTKFARASLAASGSPEPDAQLTVSGRSILWGAAFWPKPPGVPLN